ncbi:MAG: 5-oxoprolinase subunit PxpB [Bacillus sp. (in: firmicutes)]
MEYQLFPLGDQAIIIELDTVLSEDTHCKVQTITSFFEHSHPDWLIDYTPAFASFTLFYDAFLIHKQYNPKQLPYQFVASFLQKLLPSLLNAEAQASRIVEIPVCYGGELGPDLNYVAEYNHLTPSDVIRIHSSGEYLVYMLGFSPGFPYLGGMPHTIAAPRKQVPKLSIPARSVGIAGMQTGIYPIETPGGWQIIGQTPIDLFEPNNEDSPTLLRAGDHVRFISIDYEQFLNWEVHA